MDGWTNKSFNINWKSDYHRLVNSVRRRNIGNDWGRGATALEQLQPLSWTASKSQLVKWYNCLCAFSLRPLRSPDWTLEKLESASGGSGPAFEEAVGGADRWTDRWMDGCTDSLCILQDIVLSRAAAQKASGKIRWNKRQSKWIG